MRNSKKACHWFATVVGLAFFGSIAISDTAAAQKATTPGEVWLPYPSTLGQPTRNALDQTTWKVVSVTDGGKQIKLVKPFGLLFDFSDSVGVRDVLTFNGCESKRGSFELTDNLLTIAKRFGVGGCKNDKASTTLDQILSGTSTITPSNRAVWFRGITVTNGQKTAQLEPLIRSDLVGTAWVLETVLDPIPSSTPTLAFNATKFGGGDGCNSFDGNYLAIGDRLASLGMSQTLMACEGQDSWKLKPTLEGNPKFLIGAEGQTLTLIKRSGTLKYRRAKAVVRPPIPGIGL
jgi:heat shock protein HslJ